MIAGVAVLLALVGVARATESTPATVRSLTLENPNSADVEVSVSSGSDPSVMPLTTAVAQSSTVVELVIDQGSAWTFHFAGQDIAGGTLTLKRSDLVAQGWTVHIPSSVGARPTPAS